MAKKKQFVTAAAAFAVAASAVAPAITADAASTTVRLSSDYVRGGDLNAALDKEYKGSEIHWYKSSIDMNKLGVFQTAKGFVKGKGIKVEKKLRVLNYAQEIKPESEFVFEQGVPVSGIRVQPVLFADGVVYNKPLFVAGFSTEKVGEFEGTLTYSNKAYGSVTKTVKYKVVASKVAFSEVKHEVEGDTLSVSADVKNLKEGEKVELVIFPGKDESAALPAIEAEVKDGKVMASAKEIPAGTHSFILRSGDVKTEAMEFKVETTEVKSFAAVNAKSLKVEFNKPVDASKAQFELKKDGVKINASSITFNEDKSEAVIELSSKVTKGEYTVAVSGLVEGKVLNASVVAEDEKVAKIEVLSNEVPLSDLDADTNADDLAVPYKVLNQYGEDITKSSSIVASAGTVDPANGVVKFTGNYDTVTNKTVAFTLINVESNVSTSAVVTAVSKAVESSVEIKGIYNKDGKVLTETTDLSKDKFFLEIEVKDQYGKVIKNPTASTLLLSESNNTIVNVKDSAQTPTLDTATVDGKVLIAIEAPAAGIKAGETSVTLIAKNTGKSSSTVVKVAEGIRAANVTLGQPALVAAGEDALLPLTVLDKDGNEITDLDILNSSTRGLNVGSNSLVKKDGKVYLKVSTPSAGPNVALVTIIPTQKIVTANYTVRAAAAPSVIVGLDKDVQTSINTGLTETITASDLVIEDQYGRVMTDAAVNTWLDLANTAIVLNSSKEATDNSPFAITTDSSASDADKQVISASGSSFTVTAKANAANQMNTEKLTFSMSTDNGTNILASSSKEVVFTKVGIVDFASFAVVAPQTIYNDTTPFDFKVYGVKADGSKVLLKSSEYNLVVPAEFIVSGANNNVVALTGALANTVIAPDSTTVPKTKDFNFRVVIRDNAATTIDQKVTVSAEARGESKIFATTTGTSAGTELSTLTYEASTTAPNDDASIINLTTVASDVGTIVAADLEKNLYFVDQYGKETAAAINTMKLTFSNVVDADADGSAQVSNNGESTATVAGLEAGDTLTVKVEVNGLTTSYNVVIK